MKTVFLVSTGCYSGYGINSVWTTQDLAEKRAAELRKPPNRYESDDVRVEEYWLDAPTPDESPFWRVKYFHIWDPKSDLWGPNQSNVEPAEATGRVHDSPFESSEQRYSSFRKHKESFGPTDVSCDLTIQAESAEHAMKIVSDMRGAWLAQQGVTRP